MIFAFVFFALTLVFGSAQTIDKHLLVQENMDVALAEPTAISVDAGDQTNGDQLILPYPSSQSPVKKRHNSNTNPNTNTQPTQTTTVTSRTNNDDESNGRRLQPITLPLEDLSTDADSDKEEKTGLAGITGAVIGAVGGPGIAGIVTLVAILAIVGIFVYTRKNAAKESSK